MSRPNTRLHFPPDFLWGASTAAHQVEGGTHNQWTVWELEHAKTKAAQALYQYGDLPHWNDIKTEATSPDNYVSASLADHYRKYEEDFDLLASMNMNAFRFSVEWSRIEPEEGAWSVEAIEHYKRYIKALKRRNIEPVMTLFHFTLPVWVADKGGFEKRSNVKYFVRFAQKVLEELGQHVQYVITINEPEVYAFESYRLGNWPPNKTGFFGWWRVMNNLMYAHNRVSLMVRHQPKAFKISIAKNSCYFYAGDDAWLSRLSANVMQYFQDDYFLKKVVNQCDYLGINFYFSNRVYGYRIHNPDETVSDLGWDLSPADLEFVLERLYRKYKLPIMITENGLADGKDEHRKWWLSQTLMAMQRALDSGVQLRGYLHWSLLDNFEWDKGKWPRFGLAQVDYDTSERSLRKSAQWFGHIIKHLREADRHE